MNLSRRHREDDRENLDRWLITYADLITLLLAFFIMLYTFSKQDARKYQDLSSELKNIFSGGKTEKAAAVQAGVAAGQKPSTDIERELEDELAALPAGKTKPTRYPSSRTRGARSSAQWIRPSSTRAGRS